MLHVVLFRPLIPANTGNIGRTCLGFGARLHLIKPLGFDLSEREVKRAGLDHWEHVDLAVHNSWTCFTESMLHVLSHNNGGGGGGGGNIYLVSKRLKLGSTPIADVDFFAPMPKPPPISAQPGGGARELSSDTSGSSACSEGDVALVFGNEVDGLSGLEEGERGRALPAVYLPMRDDVIRSYNLSNAVAMAVYEVDRQRREAPRIRDMGRRGEQGRPTSSTT
ncbi:unnamed protein product [Ectocarpus sp. 12 AP-2014]